jgi:predicted amidohydrolase
MKIALVQMFCGFGEVDANLAAMRAFARRAKADGAEMVVFPELTISGIYKDPKVWELAQSLDGPSVRAALDLSRAEGLYIGFGFTERAPEGLPYNAYAVAAPRGELAGVYRKNYIPHLEVPFWQGHRERPVFDLGGRRFAVAICWDNTEEELLAHYGRAGARVVLMPHAWDADPLDHAGKPLEHRTILELYEHHQHGRLGGWASHDAMRDQFLAYIPLRAKAHDFYALFVNQAGQPHPAIRFEGPSFAVDPQGKLLACTCDGAEQMLYVDVP